MLPANMPEWNKAAHPQATPPLGGQGETYAVAAARGTGHQVAAAARGGDFTFTRKTPPPATVPSGVDSGRGAATSTLQRQPRTSIGEILATFQDILYPKGDLQRTSDKVAHHLQTRGPPIASKFRWLDSEKLAAAARRSSWPSRGQEFSDNRQVRGPHRCTW